MFHIFMHELKLHVRHLGDLAALILFFVICFSLFPFALGPEPQTLQTVAPGVIWVAALFTIQLSLPRLFAEDLEDGTLELLVLNCPALELAVFARLAAFWLVTALPLTLVTPLAALAFGLTIESSGQLVLSLALGSVSLILIGATATALALGSRQASMLVPLLTLPFYVPVLIFGVAAIEAVIGGFPSGNIILALTGFALFFLPVGLFLISTILKHAVRS